MAKILIIGLNLIIFCLNGQNQKYNEIDSKALSIKYLYSLESISVAINAIANSDEEKVRSMYIWLTNNIAYDTESFFSGNYPEPKTEISLKNKKAVCEGYCMLFKKFCDLNNIPCITMNGYSKGVSYRKGKVFSNTDHTWNIVRINNEWKFIEATWGAGYVTNQGFIKSFSDRYFFVSPSVFILNHLPADPMWQLLSCEVAIHVFENDSTEIKKYLSENSCTNMVETQKINAYIALDSINRFRVFNENAYQFNPKNEDGLVQLSFIYSKMAYDNILILNKLINNSDKTKTYKLASEAKLYLTQSSNYIKKVKSKEKYFKSAVEMQNQIIPHNMNYLEWFLSK